MNKASNVQVPIKDLDELLENKVFKDNIVHKLNVCGQYCF